MMYGLPRVSLRLALHGLLLTLILGSSGCSSLFETKYEPKIVNDPSPKLALRKAKEQLSDGKATEANATLNSLSDRYVHSEIGRQAMFLLIVSFYDQGKYDDAVNTIKRFLYFYPDDHHLDYIEYLLGMSYYQQIPDITRDQGMTHMALKVFKDLVQRFPKSTYTKDARSRIPYLLNQLAGLEMDVGRYYLRRRDFSAAINRFRDVIIYYQTTPQTEEALERLVEAYVGLGLFAEAQSVASVLAYNFPGGNWDKDARRILNDNHLQPKVYTESWIYKAYKGKKQSLRHTK